MRFKKQMHKVVAAVASSLLPRLQAILAAGKPGDKDVYKGALKRLELWIEEYQRNRGNLDPPDGFYANLPDQDVSSQYGGKGQSH